jgi:alkylation response protein AidB-like acyl-CoA dehydrogenase
VNFTFDEDQLAIKRTAKEFLASRYPAAVVRELADDERGFTAGQWEQLAELGWPGVIVAEADGGLGLGAVELIVVQEELGYALAPTPLLSTVCAALLLSAAGGDRQWQEWLPPIASGKLRGTLAVLDADAGWDPGRSDSRLRDGRLTARKIAVPDAQEAEVLIIAGADGEHFLVRRDAPGLQMTPSPALDPTRKLFQVSLDNTPAERLEDPDGGRVDRAYAVIATALAAENVGVAQRALEMAVAHARDRKQFDRPIGSYQAVSHRCAQMLLELEGARSLTYAAAWALDHEPALAQRAASMAKAYASDAGFRVCASALQVHGGIGFTWEHDLHFFLKRAKSNAHSFGDARWHRERVATLTAF